MAELTKITRGMQNGAETIDSNFNKINGELISGGNVVHKTGDEQISGEKSFDNLKITGKFTERTISIPYTWEYGITGTLTRVGNTVEWILDRIVVNGGNAHEQSEGATLPAGFRPIARAYVGIDLTSSSGRVAWGSARLDSNGKTYLTNSASTSPANTQGFGSWKTNDPWPEA